MHMQKVRDFPQTKLDNGINNYSPFHLNEHGNPRFFNQAFAKNSLMKNINYLKRKKSLIVEHDFFLENSPHLGVFWPRRGLQASHGTV